MDRSTALLPWAVGGVLWTVLSMAVEMGCKDLVFKGFFLQKNLKTWKVQITITKKT